MSIHTVGIVGAGTMGNGIAQVCALRRAGDLGAVVYRRSFSTSR